MLTMRIIRMAYQPILRPIHPVKPLTINPYKQCLRTMPYVNQRHASDSKKLLSWSSLINKRYDSSSAAPKITTDTCSRVTPKATAPSCAPSAAPSATPQKADSQSPCEPSAPPQKAASPQPLTGSSPSSSATSDSSSSSSATSNSSSSSSATSDSSPPSQCEQPTASASQTSASTSSTSTTSSPKTCSTPSTEQKSSTDSTKPPEIKLPSREQLEKYFFRATVVVWDTSVYLYSVTSRLFDQYVLRQPVLQQYWAVFKKKMDQARQEMRSK